MSLPSKEPLAQVKMRKSLNMPTPPVRAQNETVFTHAGTISAIIGWIGTYFGTTGRKYGRGHRLVESGHMRKSQKSPFFEPRLIEAGPFIFLY